MTAASAPVPHPHRAARRRLAWLTVVVVVAGLAFVAGRSWRSDGASGTVTGSGTPARELRSVPRFTAVELAGANDVTIHVGGKQVVAVSGDDNLVPLVTTAVDGGTLVVGTEGSFTTKAPMHVEVTVPALESAALTGSGNVSADGVRATQFTARLAGSGVLRVAGAAGSVNADLGGTGDLKLQNLVARDVTAVVAGAGRLQVHATGTIDAAVTGTGEILYAGDPDRVTRSITGTGVITPR